MEQFETSICRTRMDRHRRTAHFTAWVRSALPIPEAVRPPERIGGYRILREIGRGGMGVVYEAQHLQTRRLFALKTIPNIHHDVTGRMRRALGSEIVALSSLRHPGIAFLYEAGIDDELQAPFLVMERIDGEPYLDFAWRVPLSDRVQLFLKLASSVGFAHHHGILHLDLKPANILVNAGGNPKLIDFGLSRLMSDEHTDDTVLARDAGSVCYLSPERIIQDDGAFTSASDIYSLGLILHESLSGRRLYKSDSGSRRAIEDAICYETPPSPSAYNRRVTRDLDSIVMKSLEKSPRERYASTEALGADLKALANGQSSSTASDRSGVSVRRRSAGSGFVI